MTAQNMYSHTKEIFALTVPFLTVLIVVSLMTAGMVDNKNIPVVSEKSETDHNIMVIEPTIDPEFAGIIESTSSATEVTEDQDIIPTVTPSELPTTKLTPTATPSGILLDEAASTKSADIDN